jgi:hypothetical protein
MPHRIERDAAPIGAALPSRSPGGAAPGGAEGLPVSPGVDRTSGTTMGRLSHDATYRRWGVS